jgi:hypothetical protein
LVIFFASFLPCLWAGRMKNQSYKTPRILYDFDTISDGLKFCYQQEIEWWGK